MQNLAADVDDHRAQVEKVLRSLASLATHDKILNSDPVNTYLEHLRSGMTPGGSCYGMSAQYYTVL